MAKKANDAGQDEVQENFDEATEKGFFGPGTEGKDRERFTVAGAVGASDTNDKGSGAANGGRGQSAPTQPVTDPNAGAPGSGGSGSTEPAKE